MQGPFKHLKECPYYWGPINGLVATRLLRDRPLGTYIVRDSHSDGSVFSLSYVTADGIFHSRINFCNGGYCIDGNTVFESDSLNGLIQSMFESRSTSEILMRPLARGSRHTARILLKYPLNRNHFMPSLKYLCRLVIRDLIPDTSQIMRLPVSDKIKKFLITSNYLFVC